jgi:nucleotide-binding universal stress UspA family protein
LSKKERIWIDDMGDIDDFKRILVVLDDSERSARVMARASSIAIAFSSDLHLISVIEIPWTVASKEELETPELQFERKKLVNYQKELIDEYLVRCNLNVESHVSIGNPANEILDYADVIGADLIVIGRVETHRALKLYFWAAYRKR